MKNLPLLTATLALGCLASLTAGITLPRAQAQAGVGPTSGADLAQRAQLSALEQRLTALEGQVRLLEQQRLAEKATTVYPTRPPQLFGPEQPPTSGTGRPTRPPAYIWSATK